MATLLQELSRRNVVRATLAYMAISWLFIQIADIVLPTFNDGAGRVRALFVLGKAVIAYTESATDGSGFRCASWSSGL